jgi:hypothetical protein
MPEYDQIIPGQKADRTMDRSYGIYIDTMTSSCYLARGDS